jgi:hypothetical protein
MDIEEIKSNLCYYDDRNPNRDKLTEKKEGKCFCDNCFYGRDELANAMLKILQTKKEPMFVILDMRYTKDSKQAAFWRANACGRTVNPFNAGHYTKSEIEKNPNYYNNGHETVALPLDRIHDLIDPRCSFKLSKFHDYINTGKFKDL